LEGCAFSVDAYDVWSEVESADPAAYDSPFSRQLRPSVAFPYDLRLFGGGRRRRDGTIVARIGIDYEDCHSVYEDYEIDHDIVRERRSSHPVLLELERIAATTRDGGGSGGEGDWGAPGTVVVVRTTSSDCPAAYSRPGEKWTSVRMAEEGTLADRIDGAVWVVSHGGAHAGPLRAIVCDREDPRALDDDNDDGGESALDRILAHYPYPVRRQQQKQPKLCIYIYGSM
jgi:hypothetical protein